MPRPFLSGLRGRLLALVVLAVLPAFALTIYTGWDDRRQQRAAVAGETVSLARIVASDQERLLDSTRQILADLAQIPEVRVGDTRRCNTFFSLLMKQYPGYASFLVLDPAGNVLASFPAAERPINLSGRSWFQRVLSSRDFAVGEYQLGQLTGKAIVVAAWPALDDAGRVLSVLCAALDVSWLNHIVATAQLPKDAQLVLVDRRGTVVARYPDAAGLVGRGLGDRDLAAQMTAREEGVVEFSGEDGVTRVFAFTGVRLRVDSGLRLAIGIPSDVAFGGVQRQQRRHLLALLMVMTLTLAAAWFGAERFVLRRVWSLLDATKQLAAGEPVARTGSPYGRDELSDLARAFDEMASALQVRQSERDRAARALRESEEWFRAFMDNSPAIAYVKDGTDRLVYANATLERYFGLAAGAWRDGSDTQFWSGDVAERFRALDAEVARASEPRQNVGTVVLRDGRQRYWLTLKFPLADARGSALVATTAFDLTEWRQAQEGLARSERRYTELVDQAPDGIVITDATFCLVAANAAACRMGGYTREELLHRPVEQFLMPEDVTANPLRLEEVKAGREVVTERWLRRKDGTVFLAEIRTQPLESGGLQAFVRDVTGRHAAERALRESEERFRRLYQFLPLAYQSLSGDGTIVMVNDAWLVLTGLTRAEAIGRRFMDLLRPEDAERCGQALLEAGGDVRDTDLVILRRDGTQVVVTMDLRRGTDEHGRTRIHCALHDVTAARLAAARIRESEERYRTLFAESPIALWEQDFSGIRRHIDRLRTLGVTDLDEHFVGNPDELADCVEAVRVVDVNRATLALYGAESRSQLLAGLDRIFGRDGHDAFRQSIVALAHGRRSWDSEVLHRSLNGDPIRLALRWSVAPGAEQTWARILVSAVDITRRTAVEDALRESEARFEQVFRVAPDIMGVSRRSDGMYLDVNDAFLRDLGFRRDEVIGRTSDELGLWTRAQRGDLLSRLGDGPFLHGFEARIRRKGGGFVEGLLSVASIRMWGEDCLLVQVADMTPRRSAEEASRESERMLTTLMSNLPGMAYQCCLDPEWTMLFVSDGCRELTGYLPAEIVGNRRVSYGSLIHEEDREAVNTEVRQAVEERRAFRVTYRLRHASGQIRWVWEQGRPVGSSADQPVTLEGFVADITDRLRAEQELERSAEQLRQAQKMEAVGRLAGGIAHDFNNLLTAILGYSDIVLHRLPPGDPLVEKVEEIRRAGERAANLTRKLLAFSRKQVLAPRVVTLDALLEDMAPLLRRLIGEDIELRLVTRGAGNVKADPSQLEQVVMNLVVNARDAMPRGGRLLIESVPIDLADPASSGWPNLPPGPYAIVTISDTGVGMDDSTRSRLFEPFFTTKAQGHGTGLGLSTVYGIVQQSGGAVSVDSTPGSGTTFHIVLPTVREETLDQADGSRPIEAATGHETILVAEDEESVRRLLRTILERLGYRVLEAPDGDEAWSVWQREQGRIDLLITDIVMPRVDGPALVRLVRDSRPDAKVIYVSGYTDEAIVRRVEWEPGTPFLQKPFTSLALARTVRAVLDDGVSPDESADAAHPPSA